MRVLHPIGFFTAALLAGACQSLLLDDLPDKPSTTATSDAPKVARSGGEKSIVIRSRGEQSIKEIAGGEKPAAGNDTNNTGRSTASPSPAANSEPDTLDEIGSFFNQLFGSASSENPRQTPPDSYKAPAALAETNETKSAAATDPASDGPPPKRIERRYSAAYSVYQPLAEKGHAFAQYELALMHLHGYGVAADAKEAEQWFRKAALQGHPNAKTELRKLIAGSKAQATARADSAPAARPAPEPNAPAPEKPKLTEPKEAKPKQEEDPPTVVISADSVTTTTTTSETDSGTIIDRILPRRELPEFKKDQDQADLTKETGQLFSNIFGDGTKVPPPPNASDPREDPAPTPTPTAPVVKATPEATPKATGPSEAKDLTTSVKIVTTKPAEKTEPPAAGPPEPAKQRDELGAAVLVEPKQAAIAPTLNAGGKPKPTAAPADAGKLAEAKKNDDGGRNQAQDNASFSKGLSAYNDGDYQTAYSHWQPLATKGEAESQTRLGYLYEHGKGVEQSFDQAVTWYRKAAEQGEPAAQFNLGVMYRKGRGVTKDDKVARAWYEKAAKQGHPVAERVIEVMKAYKIGE